MTKTKLFRLRAEHDRYDVAQRLCPDAIPDENQIAACFKVERAKLSPACRKIYDRGIEAK